MPDTYKAVGPYAEGGDFAGQDMLRLIPRTDGTVTIRVVEGYTIAAVDVDLKILAELKKAIDWADWSARRLKAVMEEKEAG